MSLRQIHFASTDLELHSRFTPGNGESVFDAEKRISAKTQVGRQLLAYWLPSHRLFLNGGVPRECFATARLAGW